MDVKEIAKSSLESGRETYERVGRKVAKSALARKVESNPLLYAGLAVGTGFLLGGGLAARTAGPLVRRGLWLALRMAVFPMVASKLERASSLFGAGSSTR